MQRWTRERQWIAATRNDHKNIIKTIDSFQCNWNARLGFSLYNIYNIIVSEVPVEVVLQECRKLYYSVPEHLRIRRGSNQQRATIGIICGALYGLRDPDDEDNTRNACSPSEIKKRHQEVIGELGYK